MNVSILNVEHLPNKAVTFDPQQPIQSSGYTQVNHAFGKPSIRNDLSEKFNTKTPIVATTDQEGISGMRTIIIMSIKIFKMSMLICVNYRICDTQTAIRLWTSNAVKLSTYNYSTGSNLRSVINFYLMFSYNRSICKRIKEK